MEVESNLSSKTALLRFHLRHTCGKSWTSHCVMYTKCHSDVTAVLNKMCQQPNSQQTVRISSSFFKTDLVNIFVIVFPLFFVKDDADVAMRALPELAKLVSSNNEVTAEQAVVMAHQLSKKEASCIAMSTSQPLVTALLRTMLRSTNSEVLLRASATIHNIGKRQWAVGHNRPFVPESSFKDCLSALP